MRRTSSARYLPVGVNAKRPIVSDAVAIDDRTNFDSVVTFVGWNIDKNNSLVTVAQFMVVALPTHSAGALADIIRANITANNRGAYQFELVRACANLTAACDNDTALLQNVTLAVSAVQIVSYQPVPRPAPPAPTPSELEPGCSLCRPQ